MYTSIERLHTYMYYCYMMMIMMMMMMMMMMVMMMVMMMMMMKCVICPKKWWEGKYMHARTIHNVLTQGKTVQKGGSNPPNPRQITPWMMMMMMMMMVLCPKAGSLASMPSGDEMSEEVSH